MCPSIRTLLAAGMVFDGTILQRGSRNCVRHSFAAIPTARPKQVRLWGSQAKYAIQNLQIFAAGTSDFAAFEAVSAYQPCWRPIAVSAQTGPPPAQSGRNLRSSNGKRKKRKMSGEKKTSLKNTLTISFCYSSSEGLTRRPTHAPTCRLGNEVNLSAKSGEVGLAADSS